MTFEDKLEELLNFTFTALGEGYAASSAYMLCRTIAGSEPVETKVAYVSFSAVGLPLAYILLKKDKKKEQS